MMTETWTPEQFRKYQSKRGAGSKSKYKAKRTEYQGILYDSKLEAAFASILDVFIQAGDVLSWTRQIPFIIGMDEKGKAMIHRVDFLIHYPDRTFEYVEVKGFDKREGKIQRCFVNEKYGIDITLVFNPREWQPKG